MFSTVFRIKNVVLNLAFSSYGSGSTTLGENKPFQNRAITVGGKTLTLGIRLFGFKISVLISAREHVNSYKNRGNHQNFTLKADPNPGPRS
jgi:hypothetical protein